MKRKYIEVKGKRVYLDEFKIKEENVEETPESLVERYVENPKDKSNWWTRETEQETQVSIFKEHLNISVDKLVEIVEDDCEVHLFTDKLLTDHGGEFDDIIVICFPKR